MATEGTVAGGGMGVGGIHVVCLVCGHDCQDSIGSRKGGFGDSQVVVVAVSWCLGF